MTLLVVARVLKFWGKGFESKTTTVVILKDIMEAMLSVSKILLFVIFNKMILV